MAQEPYDTRTYREEYDDNCGHYPLFPVEMNHLELMGACMALQTVKDDDGLSYPQIVALEKLREALALALADLGIGK